MPDYKMAPVKDGSTCAHCGMEQADWSTLGVLNEGQMCCCAGCAEETGCVCAREPAESWGTTGNP